MSFNDFLLDVKSQAVAEEDKIYDDDEMWHLIEKVIS
jgi:hypothetical protein